MRIGKSSGRSVAAASRCAELVACLNHWRRGARRADRRLFKESSMNRKLVIAALVGLAVAANAASALAGGLHHGVHHAWDRGGSSFGFGVGFGDNGWGDY